MITTESFTNGKATIKNGRKIVAKVFDREAYYAANNIKSAVGHCKFSVEMLGGSFSCIDLQEVNAILTKYID